MRWAPTHIPDILQALWEHAVLVFVSVAVALLISLALGIWTARRPRIYGAVLFLTGTLFVIPSLAMFALLIPLLGLGFKPAVTGLTAYSLLILTRNIATGLRAVPPEVADAAAGVGYGAARRLLEIELPLALPFIVAGLRIATVTVIGIATVAAYINAGGLGGIIFAGIDQRYPEKILIGGGLTALLAIGTDFVLSRVERGLRGRTA
jgi:osmoprotectant transport system permease protein